MKKNSLTAALKKMKIIEKIYPSDSNFLLVKVKNSTSIYNSLVSKNIIVRNRHSVINNCLRITVGKKSENDKLIKALKINFNMKKTLFIDRDGTIITEPEDEQVDSFEKLIFLPGVIILFIKNCKRD